MRKTWPQHRDTTLFGRVWNKMSIYTDSRELNSRQIKDYLVYISINTIEAGTGTTLNLPRVIVNYYQQMVNYIM